MTLHRRKARNGMRRSVSCSVRVPSGCDPAAGDERQGGQPEQSPEAGEGSCRTRQQSGAAAGEDVIHRLKKPSANREVWVTKQKAYVKNEAAIYFCIMLFFSCELCARC